MASFTDQYALGQDDEFRSRVQQAALTAAIQVAAETADTANHYNRVRLAKRVLEQPTMYRELFAYSVATNVVIDGSSSDSDIQFTVNSLWDAFAGPLGT